MTDKHSSMNSFTVQVPASSSNCGPGFDTLSVALSLYNFVKLVPTAGPLISWCGDGPLHGQTLAMVEETAAAFFKAAQLPEQGFAFDIWGDVPVTRGLGSSATIRTGMLAALNAWQGDPLDRRTLVRLGTNLDQAADGISACFYGGFCVSRVDPQTGQYRDTLRFDVPEHLAFVVVSPEIPVHTPIARSILPAEVPFQETVHTLNSLAWLVSVFASGQYEHLRGAVTDFIHQPYRMKLTPFVEEAIAAGREAGAYDGWLSGSGSSVLCVTPAEHAFAVAKAMGGVYFANGIDNRSFQLKVDNTGLRLA